MEPYELTLDPWPEPSADQIGAYLSQHIVLPMLLGGLVAGSAIWDDIWGAVQKLLDIPGNLGAYLLGKFNDVAGWISNQGTIVFQAVTNTLSPVLQQVLSIVNNVLGLVQGVPGVITSAIGGISGLVQSLPSTLGSLLQSAVNFLAGIISPITSTLGQLISSGVQTLFNLVAGLPNTIAGFITSAVTYLAGLLGALPGQLASFVQSAASSILGVVGGVAGFLTGTILPAILKVYTIQWEAVSWVFNQIWDLLKWLNDVLVRDNDTTRRTVTGESEKVTETIFNTVIQGAAALGEGFLDGLKWLIEQPFTAIAGPLAVKASVPRKMLTGQYQNLNQILDDLDDPIEPGSFAGFLFSLAAFLPALGSLAVGLGPIYAADSLQQVSQSVGPQLPALVDARDAFLRGFIGEAEHDELLGRMGFNRERIGWLKQLYFQLATPSDLIRFLVREVFDPASRQELSLDADFPSAAVAEGRKIGLGEQTLRDYWAAHWNLPGPSQVYTMLHRGLIDAGAVDRYLKAADFAPIWRQNLASISYNVPGRIDLRRMFAAGVIDEARVLKGYQDLGYNPDDARILTDFAKKQAAGQDKDLPRNVITKAYRERALARDAAAGELEGLGFDGEQAEFLLDLEDLAVAEEDAALEEDIIEADFKAGLLAEGPARSALAELGRSQDRIDLLIRRWANRKAVKTATLSVAQVQRAFREGRLTDQAALGRFSALGYNPVDAGELLADARPDVAVTEPPELSLAQLFRALREDLLNEDQLRGRLQRRGYSPDDLQVLLDLATPDQPAAEPAELTKADIRALLRAQLIDSSQAQARLASKGLVQDDIDLLLALWNRAPA